MCTVCSVPIRGKYSYYFSQLETIFRVIFHLSPKDRMRGVWMGCLGVRRNEESRRAGLSVINEAQTMQNDLWKWRRCWRKRKRQTIRFSDVTGNGYFLFLYFIYEYIHIFLSGRPKGQKKLAGEGEKVK